MFESFYRNAKASYTWVIHTSPDMQSSDVVGLVNINGVVTQYGVDLVYIMPGGSGEYPFSGKLTGNPKEDVFWCDILAFREFKTLGLASFAPGHDDELTVLPTAFEEDKNCWVVYATSDGGNVFEYGNVSFFPDRGVRLPGESDPPAPVPCFNFLGLAACEYDHLPIDFAIAHSDELVGIREAREAAKAYLQKHYG